MNKIRNLTKIVLLIVLGVMIATEVSGAKPEFTFYTEFLDYQRLAQPEVIELLKKYEIKLCIATDEEKLLQLIPLLKKYQRENIEFSIWPLLAKEDGYWPSERNVNKLDLLLDKIFKMAYENDIKIKEIVIDLEPPQLYNLSSSPMSASGILAWAKQVANQNLNRKKFKKSLIEYQKIIEKIHQHKARAVATTLNFVLEEVGNPQVNAFQDFLEAPVFGLNWDVIDFQYYTSKMVGFKILFWRISYRDLNRALYSLAKRAKAHLSCEISFSLGIFYPQSEIKYLISDIEALLGAGIEKIAVYSLDGILQFDEPEKVLEKIFQAEPKIPPLRLGSSLFIVSRKLAWLLLRFKQ
jgi:hypothetical protein